MEKKLFMVCPFSCLEGFLEQHYGDSYFLTAPAAVFSATAEEFKAYLPSFLQSEGITDLYLVSDVACPFIDAALAGRQLSRMRCEKIVRQLRATEASPFDVSKKLVLQQLQLFNDQILSLEKGSPQVRLHGLVTFREENLIAAVA